MPIDRCSYIGGSNAATIMGSNEYDVLLALWENKICGIDKDINNPDIQRGIEMEPRVLRWLSEHTDYLINLPEHFDKYDDGGGHNGQIFVRHPELDFVGGHPDGIGGNRDEGTFLWEIKAPRQTSVVRMMRTGISPRYYWQVQHYMACTGIESAKVAMWDYDSWESYIVTVDRNDNAIRSLLARYREFWHCVQTETTPASGTKDPESSTKIISDAVDRMLGEYVEYRNKRFESKDLENRIRGQILTELRGRDSVTTDRFTVKISRNLGKSNYTRLTVKER